MPRWAVDEVYPKAYGFGEEAWASNGQKNVLKYHISACQGYVMRLEMQTEKYILLICIFDMPIILYNQ